MVWNLRSRLCKSVQNVSDQCDVWALFTKPKSHPNLPPIRKVVNEIADRVEESNDRLANAIERQTKMHAERDRLRSEPDTGDEFLRYVYDSGNMMGKLSNVTYCRKTNILLLPVTMFLVSCSDG